MNALIALACVVFGMVFACLVFAFCAWFGDVDNADYDEEFTDDK